MVDADKSSLKRLMDRLGREFWAIRNGTGGTAITLIFELGDSWSFSLHTLRGLGEWECECKKLANEKGCVKAIIEGEAHYSWYGEYCRYHGQKIKTEGVS